MNKSFVERIFPHSPGSSLLPQHDYSRPGSSFSDAPSSPHRIDLRDSIALSKYGHVVPSPSPSPSTTASRKGERPSPSPTPIPIHHADPLLPVERAAKSLERTIQGLLDAQSEGLSAGLGQRHGDDNYDASSSVGSPTPTPSTATPPPPHRTTTAAGGGSNLRTIPIRQPQEKKTSLRGARRGLSKRMKEFAELKQWEVAVLDRELASRDAALRQADAFTQQQRQLETEIHTITTTSSSGSPSRSDLRGEADALALEIRRVENSLHEMKARHRHLLARAAEHESALESELASFRAALALNARNVASFLRHPPVTPTAAAAAASSSTANEANIHTTPPARRTLPAARDQWTREIHALTLRRSSAASERQALEAGGALWRDAVQRITAFETTLRTHARNLSASSTAIPNTHVDDDDDDDEESLLHQLDGLIASLEDDLATAQGRSWNLLVCTLGAELEAFTQARALLRPSSSSSVRDGDNVNINVNVNVNGAARDSSPGAESNRSLEDTLREFGGGSGGSAVQSTMPAPSAPAPESPDERLAFAPEVEPQKNKGKAYARSESEDDDPGPDFFLEHS